MADRPQADDHLSEKRTEPPLAGDELATLNGFLDFQRQTVLLKCAGLSPAQLVTPAVASSNLRLLGILRHLVDVERGWLSEVFTGAAELSIWGPEPDADLLVEQADAESVAATFARYAEEVERSRAIVAAAQPGQLSVGLSRTGVPFSLRWILVHLIEEYARHNGHADLIRQALDGAVGE